MSLMFLICYAYYTVSDMVEFQFLMVWTELEIVLNQEKKVFETFTCIYLADGLVLQYRRMFKL